MKRVVLHIDRLVLKGFGQDDHHRIAADLQEEFGRLLSDPATAEQLASLSHVPSIRVGTENLGQVEKPVSGGISAAKAIARGLSR